MQIEGDDIICPFDIPEWGTEGK